LKAAGNVSQGGADGVFDALKLMRSDLLFNLGYAVLWVGLFAAARGGFFRRIVVFLFHATAVLVVATTTFAYQYFEATGSTLDYSVVYYLAKLGEIDGLIAREAVWYVWVFLAAALLYVVLGPWVLARNADTRSEDRPNLRQLGFSRLTSSGICLAAAALVALSLVPGAADANRSFSLSPPVNVLATGVGGPDPEELTNEWSNPSTENPLREVRLKKTLKTESRNVVLIHLESTRARSVTPYNEGIETTPFLERLADRSLLAERAYTTTPHTSKAITSLNCGIYPHPTAGIIEVEPGAIPVRCLPELLKEQGYDTVFFQSATEKFEDRPQLTKNFGYEEFYGLEDMDKEGFQSTGFLGHEDDVMLEPSRDWLQENGDDGPFLATYVTIAPHYEYLTPDRYGYRKFAEEEMLDRYLNNVRYLDFFVKGLIEQYKDLGLYEDTIFVLYGDHGEGFAEHGVKGHNEVIYEEGLRIPLIIHDPRRWQGGERLDAPVNLMDVPPTIVDMLGYEVVNGEYPGYSLLEPLPEDRPLFFNCRPDLLCVASIRGHEKYIYHYGRQPEEFYDLSEDPLERNNLAEEVGDGKLAKWRSALLRWRSEAATLYEEPPQEGGPNRPETGGRKDRRSYAEETE